MRVFGRTTAIGVIICASVVVLAALGTEASAAEMRPMVIANWSGGSFSNDQTSKFSHCALGAAYQSGITLFIVMNRHWVWSLGFSKSDWALQTGAQIPVQVSFDGKAPYGGTAQASMSNLVVLPMAESSKLLRA